MALNLSEALSRVANKNVLVATALCFPLICPESKTIVIMAGSAKYASWFAASSKLERAPQTYSET